MSASIRIHEKVSWDSYNAIFYSALTFIRERLPEDSPIWKKANWGIEAACKFCDFSSLTAADRATVVSVLDDYLPRVEDITKTWKPGAAPMVREEVTPLRDMLAERTDPSEHFRAEHRRHA